MRQKISVSDIPIELLYNKEVNEIKMLEHKHNLACQPIPITWKIEDESFNHEGMIEVTFNAKVRSVELKKKYNLTYPFKTRSVQGKWVWSDFQQKVLWSEEI